MSWPTEGSWAQLKRLGRYLESRIRSQQVFAFQRSPKALTLWADSDWAGCTRTRRSTSGGLVMHGQHLIRSWSSTQAHVALSSGEAEYHAAVRGGAHGLGSSHMMGELGVEWTQPLDLGPKQ